MAVTRAAIIAIVAYAAAVTVFLSRPSQASTCWVREHVAAYLREAHGVTLHSWGLSDDGDMMELFLGDRGHWAVVTTTPRGCASVAMPHQLRGRLWTPPRPNNALPDTRQMNRGSPL
jgi:hypothetical protein